MEKRQRRQESFSRLLDLPMDVLVIIDRFSQDSTAPDSHTIVYREVFNPVQDLQGKELVSWIQAMYESSYADDLSATTTLYDARANLIQKDMEVVAGVVVKHHQLLCNVKKEPVLLSREQIKSGIGLREGSGQEFFFDLARESDGTLYASIEGGIWTYIGQMGTFTAVRAPSLLRLASRALREIFSGRISRVTWSGNTLLKVNHVELVGEPDPYDDLKLPPVQMAWGPCGDSDMEGYKAPPASWD